MTDVFQKTAQFNQEIIGLKRPLVPTRLSPARARWFKAAMEEELDEFFHAVDLGEEVDAILDMMYFAGGRLYEMGVDAHPIFEAIHQANMSKKRGELSKRPGSLGFDAIKPEGWTAPDVNAILAEQPRPKLLIVGHGRHGKDTVGELLRDDYGLSFKSSSLFCAEKVLWPIFLGEQEAPIDRLEEFRRATYSSPMECYNHRHEFRDVWFQAIKWWCNPHWRLGQAIFAEHDIYCGVRNPAELFGIWNAGLADAIVWVDASGRLPPEDASSMKLEPWMATHHIDNNGTLDDLKANVQNLVDGLYA